MHRHLVCTGLGVQMNRDQPKEVNKSARVMAYISLGSIQTHNPAGLLSVFGSRDYFECLMQL